MPHAPLPRRARLLLWLGPGCPPPVGWLPCAANPPARLPFAPKLGCRAPLPLRTRAQSWKIGLSQHAVRDMHSRRCSSTARVLCCLCFLCASSRCPTSAGGPTPWRQEVLQHDCQGQQLVKPGQQAWLAQSLAGLEACSRPQNRQAGARAHLPACHACDIAGARREASVQLQEDAGELQRCKRQTRQQHAESTRGARRLLPHGRHHNNAVQQRG